MNFDERGVIELRVESCLVGEVTSLKMIQAQLIELPTWPESYVSMMFYVPKLTDEGAMGLYFIRGGSEEVAATEYCPQGL